MERFPSSHGGSYDERFFASQVAGSMRSARSIARLVCQLFQPKSVVDVGCGMGAWLAAFRELGLSEIRGVDGDYVDQNRLLFDRSDFIAADLSHSFDIPGRYDLAVCVEVAEHLPARCSGQLVRTLTHVAPLVLFSAAIPGQGGTGHINEQWPSYWRFLFEAEDYHMFDSIRPRIRDDNTIEWWYRQNLVMFASQEAIGNHTELACEPPMDDIEWVHISLVRRKHDLRASLLKVPGVRQTWNIVKPWVRSNLRGLGGSPRSGSGSL